MAAIPFARAAGELDLRSATDSLGVRGEQAINRSAGRVIPPCMYVAGLFDTPDSEHAIPELIPGADWLQLRITLGGVPLHHNRGNAVATSPDT